MGFGVSGVVACPDPAAPRGACCVLDGTCEETPEAWCSGDWLGEGSGCDPNPCAAVGACCVGYTCVIRTEPNCPGEWMGPDTVCSPNPCCREAGAGGSDTIDKSVPVSQVGPGLGTIRPSPEASNPCPGSSFLENVDGTFENGYAWQYGGIVPPYYGAFAEGYSGQGLVCGIRFHFTTQECYFYNAPFDAYVWSSDGTNPANVLCVTHGNQIDEPAYWPSVSTYDISFPYSNTGGSFFVGFWSDWSESLPEWYVGADLDGFGGQPRTNIAPGIGYATGWQDVSVVWGPTEALGISVYVGEYSTAVEITTWGRIKNLYR